LIRSGRWEDERPRKMRADRPFNLFFPCTGNSARSVMAEAILNKVAGGKFRAFNAGSQPKRRVHPETIELLQGSATTPMLCD
jgi:protein-tyrosine-phosphatase